MTSANLPSHTSVVVIGGGVMGCSTLYHLAKRGVGDAILLERNRLTSGTTWHSAAQVRALRSSQNLTELIRYSISLYRELEEETGQATGWINKGSLSIATTPDRMIHIERQANLAALFDVEAEMIGPGEAGERWPLMNAGDVIGAVWSPGDGRVSPSDLCAALIKGARDRGARIFEQTGVTGILTRNGRVHGVETPRGKIACDALAICAGLWSREVAAMADEDAPLWPCEHFYLLTRPVPGIEGNLPTLSDHDSHLYIRDDSGGLLVGCFEPMGKATDAKRLGPDFAFQLLPEDWDHFEPMMVKALHRLPALRDAEVKTLLNGPESFTPDGDFLLGEAPETRGLFLGCGMNSVGVATGGGAGMALAHGIVEGRFPFDLSETHPARFPRGVFSAEALAARAPEVLGKHYEIAYPGRQWQTARDLRVHPLAARFRKAGATTAQVHGWERPLFFGNPPPAPPTFARPWWHDRVAAEVLQAHEKAALLDLTTFGVVDVEGADAAVFLDRLCANGMDREPGRVIYTQMLNDRGGIESDLTAIRLSETRYRLSLGTTAIRRDLAWLRGRLEDERAAIVDRTAEIGTIALMGPATGGIVARLGADEILDLRYFQSCEAEISGLPVRAARLSYIGEPGWEIGCAMADIPALWDALAAAGTRPAGLYAQTAMRLEKGFVSHGHDVDSDTTPLQAGIDFAIDWSTPFIGREALARVRDRGGARRLFSAVLADPAANPIGGEPILHEDRIVGRTTSAAFGHRIGRPVMLALLSHPLPPETELEVHVRIADRLCEGRILQAAPFDPQGCKMRQ